MSIRRDEMEVLHIEEKKAVVLTLRYSGEPECAGDLVTLLGDAWHQYAVEHNVDPVKGMEMIHAFKNKH